MPKRWTGTSSQTAAMASSAAEQTDFHLRTSFFPRERDATRFFLFAIRCPDRSWRRALAQQKKPRGEAQDYRIWKSCAHTSPCGMDRIGEATQSFRIGSDLFWVRFGSRRRLALDPGEYNKGKAICESPTVRRGSDMTTT